MLKRLVGLLVLAAVVVGAWQLWGGGSPANRFEAYCKEVTDRRDDLGAALGSGQTTGLLRALPSFKELAAEAPDDIADDWAVVLDRIKGLRDALEDAGVDPATYDPEHPPAGLSAEDKEAIQVAADRLANTESVAALKSVEQQARDVCKSPLSL